MATQPAGSTGLAPSGPDPRLVRLSVALEGMRRDRDTVDAACARLTEAMAATALRLAQDARNANFSPPEWPGGIDRTVEIRLSETREVTLRIPSSGRPEDIRA